MNRKFSSMVLSWFTTFVLLLIYIKLRSEFAVAFSYNIFNSEILFFNFFPASLSLISLMVISITLISTYTSRIRNEKLWHIVVLALIIEVFFMLSLEFIVMPYSFERLVASVPVNFREPIIYDFTSMEGLAKMMFTEPEEYLFYMLDYGDHTIMWALWCYISLPILCLTSYFIFDSSNLLKCFLWIVGSAICITVPLLPISMMYNIMGFSVLKFSSLISTILLIGLFVAFSLSNKKRLNSKNVDLGTSSEKDSFQADQQF